MKIGIITIFKASNYGAELQAYALQKKLEMMGFDCELINYPFYKNPAFKRTPLARPVFQVSLKNRSKEFLFPLFQKIRRLSGGGTQSEKELKMDEFHQQFTRLSKCAYYTVDDLLNSPPVYDAYIVGSDQVWNPRTYCNIDPYFLSFVPEGKLKISYASSFGVEALNDEQAKYYRNKLSGFSSLSVRESGGVSIIQDLLGRKAAHVLDPTLLLNEGEWGMVAQDTGFDEPYVLLYDLITSDVALELAKKIAKVNGNIKVVALCGESGINQKGVVNAGCTGPSEFINLFSKATAVVTSSFHGTAFSINFNKPFVSVVPARMKNAGRINSILSKLSLEDRIMKEGETFDVTQWKNINFDKVNDLMAELREESVNYLKAALSDENNE